MSIEANVERYRLDERDRVEIQSRSELFREMSCRVGEIEWDLDQVDKDIRSAFKALGLGELNFKESRSKGG